MKTILVLLVLFTVPALARPKLEDIARSPKLWSEYMGDDQDWWYSHNTDYATRLAVLKQWFGSQAKFDAMPLKDFQYDHSWEDGQIYEYMRMADRTDDPVVIARCQKRINEMIVQIEAMQKKDPKE